MRSVLLFIFLVRCAHLNRGAFLLGCIISTYSCALGSNSHRFSVVGDGYPRNSQVLYTHEKDSLLKVGCPSPIQGVWTVARKIFIYIYTYLFTVSIYSCGGFQPFQPSANLATLARYLVALASEQMNQPYGRQGSSQTIQRHSMSWWHFLTLKFNIHKKDLV